MKSSWQVRRGLRLFVVYECRGLEIYGNESNGANIAALDGMTHQQRARKTRIMKRQLLM